MPCLFAANKSSLKNNILENNFMKSAAWELEKNGHMYWNLVQLIQKACWVWKCNSRGLLTIFFFFFFFLIFNLCWYWHKFKIISKRYFLLISSFEMSLMTWNLLLILHSLSMFLFEFHKNNVNSYKTHFSWQGLQLIEASKNSPYLFFQ